MGSYANILTPRRKHVIWPLPNVLAGSKELTFAPTLLFSGSSVYVPPPPPKPLNKLPAAKEATEKIDVSELEDKASRLREEATQLESEQKEKPTVRIELGLLLLEKDDMIRKLLKYWDAKGKGEFLKGEFRLNLRNVVPHATGADADELFDSWDEDKVRPPAWQRWSLSPRSRRTL